MADEQNSQVPKNGGSNKMMLFLGVLLGVAIISSIGFFVMLFKNPSSGVTKEPEAKGEQKENNAQNQKADDNNEAQAPNQNIDLSKLELNAGDHIKGDQKAPVTVVVYDDFECPFCGAFEGVNQQVMDYLVSKYPTWKPVMPNLIKEYISTGTVKLVYRHYPLPASMHPNAMSAAEASECAAAQGKFWEMHDKIFQMNSSESLSVENFKQAARDLKLNMDKYNSCMDKHEMKQRVEKDKASGEALGVNGTPGTFINGVGLSGAVSYDEFKQVIEEQLKK